METRHGIPASPGVAIGPALILDTEGVRIPRRHVAYEAISLELERLRVAIQRASDTARQRSQDMAAKHGKEIGKIFESHAMLLMDQTLRFDIEMLIRAESYSAEYAISRHIRQRVKSLDESGNEFAKRFRSDLIDLERQLLHHLVEGPGSTLENLNQPVIVLAHDLTPSQTALFNTATIQAFATESGGPTSHTVILAGALNIPAVVGVDRFLTDVSGGDIVIVDGYQGTLIIDPDDETLAYYEELRRTNRKVENRYEATRHDDAVTKDGVTIHLLGNIEFPSEAQTCLDRGAGGVGLYRTEFLYLNKSTDPTEDEHYQAYCEVLRTLGPNRPVIIRTLDLGADKFHDATGGPPEKNPFLGLRSVRFCLKNKPLFKTQLRAILRASVLGDVRIMFPMVSTVSELQQCYSLLRDVEEDLAESRIDYKSGLPVGTMIEVPSAAVMADELAKKVKFFSIGTNDLVQYTLAADRNNEAVANLYTASDPAVLRLIRMVAEAGKKAGIEVDVCGEMSGEPMYVPLLIGLGIRHLSATPRKIPEIKHVIRALSVSETERVARDALLRDNAREITTFLREQLRRFLPDTAD